MNENLFSLNNKIYSNNNNILLEIVNELQQINNSINNNIIIKRISDIIMKINYIYNENKKNLELIRKDIYILYSQLNQKFEQLNNNMNNNMNQMQYMNVKMNQMQNQMNSGQNAMNNMMNQPMIMQNQKIENQNKLNQNDQISVIFRFGTNKGEKLISVQGGINDKVSSFIEKFRNKTDTNRYIFNAKQLNKDLTAAEAGINNGATIIIPPSGKIIG